MAIPDLNLSKPFVITISRELGSGGRTIGRILAQRLGVRYCDKDLIEALMRKFDLSASRIEQLKSEKRSWLSDFVHLLSPVPKASLVLGMQPQYAFDLRPDDVSADDIYHAEAEILREIAAEGSCVIAGRSGFFLLRDCPNKLDIFITASREYRLRRVMAKQSLSRAEAEALLTEVDASREHYIQRYTGCSRYDLRNYHLCLQVDGMPEEQAADAILALLRKTTSA